MFLRHGLPGLVLAGICLWLPAAQAPIASTAALLLAESLRYVGLFAIAALLLAAHSRWRVGRWDPATLAWVGYLGLLSAWEEWAFRAVLPYALADLGMQTLTALIAVNVLFGALHYVTLRWRWQWCVGAALGGLALSRHFQNHGDFLMLVLFHWLGTTLNTPRPPGDATSSP